MQNVKELREDCGLGAVTVKKSPSVKQNANAVPGSPQFILAKQLTYICHTYSFFGLVVICEVYSSDVW